MTSIKTCTPTHIFNDGELVMLGAYDRVTPTMNWVKFGKSEFLVDCGIADYYSDIPSEALNAETVLLTHAHNDHLSGLARLISDGKLKHILATPPTLEIALIQLKDGLRLNGVANSEIQKITRRFMEIKQPVVYGSKTVLDEVDTTCCFVEAGHILGSASIELCSKNSRIVISGDLGRPGSPILRDYNTSWSKDRTVDLVLLETTYGDREQETAPSDLADSLEKAILHALKDGGHILVPTFAIGRAQILLYLLNELVEAKRLPKLPVAIDTPMGISVTETYKKFEKLYDREYIKKLEQGDDPINFDNLFAVHKTKDSYRIADLKESFLILSGSGMCTGGRIINHLVSLLPKPETDLIFVGYQAPGTIGHDLQKIGENKAEQDNYHYVEIKGQRVEVRANITTLRGMSAHADRGELADWLSHISDIKTLALHHGEPDAQKSFANYILEKGIV